jgi:hypothetical protein
MSEGKKDIGRVLSTVGKLFFGTDKEVKETATAIAKDAAKTIKRVRAREGAINAIAENVEDEPQEADKRPSERP